MVQGEYAFQYCAQLRLFRKLVKQLAQLFGLRFFAALLDLLSKLQYLGMFLSEHLVTNKKI